MESLSEQTELTDDQINRLADAQIKAYLGGQHVELLGQVPPDGWTEATKAQHCGVCDSGRYLEKQEPAICLRCLRADKKLDRVLTHAAKWESRQRAIQTVLKAARIKRNAEMQRLTGNGRRNRGAQPGRGSVEAMLNRGSSKR